jgi:hypothetical protein
MDNQSRQGSHEIEFRFFEIDCYRLLLSNQRHSWRRA